MLRRPRSRVLVALVALAALGLIAAVHGPTLEPLLYLAPAVLLALPLLGGRFVGERVLAAARGERRRRRPSTAPTVSRRSPAPVRISGGRLIACALGKRGPPAVCA
jgi:hypothetical protein